MQRAERKAVQEAGARDEGLPAVSLPPLRVSGLVVSKADLVAALRAYVPQLVDVRPLEGDLFLLSLDQAAVDDERR